MKRIISLCLSLTLVLSVLFSFNTAFAKKKFEECENFVCKGFMCCYLRDDYVYIYGYKGDKVKELVVPSTVEGYPVKSIVFSEEDRCGDSCDLVEKVTVSEGIESIAGFDLLKNLKEIYLPNSVTNIGMDTFSSCEKLSTIRLGNKIEKIEASAFSGTEYVKNHLEDGVVYYNNYLIYSENDVKNIVVKDGTTLIADGAFSYKDKLESISLPDSITKMPSFKECTHLKEVNIPKGVKRLPRSCFKYCKSLKSITVPENITYIPRYCFMNCKKLSNVTLSKNVAQIYKNAFRGCKSLKTITLPKGLKVISTGAFLNSGLESIYIPKKVETIRRHAFSKCKNLKTVKLNKNNKSFYMKKGALYRSDDNSLVWKAKK